MENDGIEASEYRGLGDVSALPQDPGAVDVVMGGDEPVGGGAVGVPTDEDGQTDITTAAEPVPEAAAAVPEAPEAPEAPGSAVADAEADKPVSDEEVLTEHEGEVPVEGRAALEEGEAAGLGPEDLHVKEEPVDSVAAQTSIVKEEPGESVEPAESADPAPPATNLVETAFSATPAAPSAVLSPSNSEHSDSDHDLPAAQELHTHDDVKMEPLHSKEPVEEYIPQTHAIVIPLYALWFNHKRIHTIEEELLPEYFNGAFKSKTPEVYMHSRNFMVNTYRLNPNEYLTFTACRRNLVGDAGALMRVHKFLSKWGLINYQVDPQLRPGPVDPPTTEEFRVLYDTPRGLFPFELHAPPTELPDLQRVKLVLGTTKRPSEEGVGNGHGAAVNGTTKRPRVTAAAGEWTPAEVRQLVDGVSKFRNDWYAVADHVGLRSVEECIVRFLQLPIEDPFLEDAKLGVLKHAHLPFLQADNPVISTVAFLAGMVDVDVAKAASGRASKVAEEQMVKAIEKKAEEAKAAEEGKAGEAAGEAAAEEGKTGEAAEEAAAEAADVKMDGEQPDAQAEKPTEAKPEGEAAAETRTENGLEEQAGSGKEEEHSDAAASAPASLAETALGIAGARSHVFATMEERELHRLTQQVVNQQVTKLELKMAKFEAIERQLEYERKVLADQQEQLYVQRLQLNQRANDVVGKLAAVVAAVEGGAADGPAAAALAEAKRALAVGPRGLVYTERESEGGESAQNGHGEAAVEAGTANEGMLPPSMAAPETFTLWRP